LYLQEFCSGEDAQVFAAMVMDARGVLSGHRSSNGGDGGGGGGGVSGVVWLHRCVCLWRTEMGGELCLM
jgi:hypothetical protein